MERRKILRAKKWWRWWSPLWVTWGVILPCGILLIMLSGLKSWLREFHGYVPYSVEVATTVFAGILAGFFSLNLLCLLFIPKLVCRLGSPKERERLEAFSQILDTGEKAIPLLVQALETPPLLTRAWDAVEAHELAVEGLGLLKAKQAIDVLYEALEHPSPSVRAKAVWALGEIGDPSVIPHLIPLLGDHETVSDHAATVLEKFGEGDLVHAFKKALTGKVDEQARKILSGEYRPQVVKAFVKALNSESPSVAIGAAWALGELRFVEALPVLESKARSFLTPMQVLLACREAAAKLRPFAYLPAIPSVSPEVANLPRPATATEIPKETLPRAVPISEVSEESIVSGSAKSDGEMQ